MPFGLFAVRDKRKRQAVRADLFWPIVAEAAASPTASHGAGFAKGTPRRLPPKPVAYYPETHCQASDARLSALRQLGNGRGQADMGNETVRNDEHVQTAVLTLFEGAAPEKNAELKRLWIKYSPRFNERMELAIMGAWGRRLTYYETTRRNRTLIS